MSKAKRAEPEQLAIWLPPRSLLPLMTYALQKGMCDSNSHAKLSIQKHSLIRFNLNRMRACTSSRKLQHRHARLGGSQAIAIRSVPKTLDMHISIFCVICAWYSKPFNCNGLETFRVCVSPTVGVSSPPRQSDSPLSLRIAKQHNYHLSRTTLKHIKSFLSGVLRASGGSLKRRESDSGHLHPPRPRASGDTRILA